MTETTLYRGIRKDTGEWVYGFYLQTKAGLEFIVNDDRDSGQLKFFEIIPETAGQYIGQKDFNGNRIFEKDILDREDSSRFYILFKDGAFRMVPTNKVQRNNWKWRTADRNMLDEYQVTGDLYHNPDLVEE